MRATTGLCVLLVGLLELAAGGLALLAALSLPPMTGELTVAGLEEPVSIRRDAFGVPVIDAANERDAYFALGFVHAQDRMWQMELRRRAGAGRLAEMLGAEALPMDRFARLLGLERRAKASLEHFTPADRRLIEAYAAGVNAWLADQRLPQPPFVLLGFRPEPWRAADSLLVQKLLALDLEQDFRDEMLRSRLLARLGPDRYADLWPDGEGGEPVTLAPHERAALEARAVHLAALETRLPAAGPPGASNAWAVAPPRTVAGVAMLANDPHLRLEWPALWYLVRIRTPGLTLTGATLPGLPAVVIGHSDHLAWGFTTTGADTQDLFEEHVDPADPARYLTPEGPRPFVVRSETIAVAGGEAETLRVRETRHGPLLSDLWPAGRSGNRLYALAWTALAEDDTTLAFGLRLARARTPAEIAQAAALFVGPVHNLLWAARDGTIGFRVLGRVPVREGRDGTLPADGRRAADDWRGTVPPEEMPAVVDPPAGVLINANNRPVSANARYPLARFWPDALRAERIAQMLAGRRGLELADFARIQLDLLSGLVRHFRGLLRRVSFDDPRLSRMRDAILTWDGRMTTGRFEPLLFAAWYRLLAEELYADELGPLFGAYRGIRFRFVARVFERRREWCDDVRTTAREDCDLVVGRAFARAVDWLSVRYGPDPRQWRWGAAHPASMRDPVLDEVPWLGALFRLRRESPGDATTVDVGRWSSSAPFRNHHAAGLRMLVELGTPVRARFIIATGQSGHPLSPHARDLADAWVAGRYLRIGDCDATTVGCRTLRLRPAPADGSR